MGRKRKSSGVPSEDTDLEVRRGRVQEADEELRMARKGLEAKLRARYPELFDHRGKLNTAALAQLLAQRTGNKQVLTGAELLALEEAADAAGSTVRAP